MRLSSVLMLCILLAGCGKPGKFKPRHVHALPFRECVLNADFSPDGKMLLVEYALDLPKDYNNLHLFDVETGKKIWAAKGPHGMIRFSPDGKTIKMVSKNKITSLTTKNGTETDKSDLNQLPIAFTDDLSLAITAVSDTDFTLSLYDVNKNQPIRKLTKSTTGIRFVRFSPDKKHVLFAFRPVRDDLLLFVLVDLTTGNTLWTLNGHNSDNDIGIFSPDGKQVIVSGREDSDDPLETKLYLKDALTGNTIRTLKGHSAGIQTIAFTPDGQHVYAAGKDDVLKKWHVETGVETWKFRLPPNKFVVFSPDVKKVLVASNSMIVTVWELENMGQPWITRP